MKYITAACLLGFFLTFSPLASAAPAKKAIPTKITSVSMEYDAPKQTVVFLGNVYVKRPDFELWSKKLTVYLKKSSDGSGSDSSGGLGSMKAGDIDRLVAEGDVRIKSGDKSGTCQKATYFASSETIVMEGPPMPILRDSSGQIQGEVITHYLETNKSTFKGGVSANFETPDRTAE